MMNDLQIGDKIRIRFTRAIYGRQPGEVVEGWVTNCQGNLIKVENDKIGMILDLCEAGELSDVETKAGEWDISL